MRDVRTSQTSGRNPSPMLTDLPASGPIHAAFPNTKIRDRPLSGAGAGEMRAAGVGKSSLAVVQALELVTGRKLPDRCSGAE